MPGPCLRALAPFLCAAALSLPAVDVVARMLQLALDQSLGQRVVLDYKPGAGGNVASEVVANKKLSFDVESDFTPISTLVDVSNVLTINPRVIDATSVKDFIAKVKAAPAKYNYASTGNCRGTHLAFAEFNAGAGLDMVHLWFGIFAPRGLDRAIALRMNLAIKTALADPETQKKLVALGNTPRYETLDQFAATVHADRARWAEVVKSVGATIE